jgi:hypothetical protein
MLSITLATLFGVMHIIAADGRSYSKADPIKNILLELGVIQALRIGDTVSTWPFIGTPKNWYWTSCDVQEDVDYWTNKISHIGDT